MQQANSLTMGLLVDKDSLCTLEESRLARPWVIKMRMLLLQKQVLIEKEGMLTFESDYIFASPSAAAAVVLARSANGWLKWKDKTGTTLDALKRK